MEEDRFIPKEGTYNLNMDERLIIEEGCKNGWKHTKIAGVLLRSVSCVKKEIKMAAGRGVYNAESAQREADLRAQAKRGKLYCRFTEEEIKYLHDAAEKGCSINEMSNEIKKCRRTISSYLKKSNISTIKKKTLLIASALGILSNSQ